MTLENDARACNDFEDIKKVLIKISTKIDSMEDDIIDLWSK